MSLIDSHDNGVPKEKEGTIRPEELNSSAALVDTTSPLSGEQVSSVLSSFKDDNSSDLVSAKQSRNDSKKTEALQVNKIEPMKEVAQTDDDYSSADGVTPSDSSSSNGDVSTGLTSINDSGIDTTRSAIIADSSEEVLNLSLSDVPNRTLSDCLEQGIVFQPDTKKPESLEVLNDISVNGEDKNPELSYSSSIEDDVSSGSIDDVEGELLRLERIRVKIEDRTNLLRALTARPETDSTGSSPSSRRLPFETFSDDDEEMQIFLEGTRPDVVDSRKEIESLNKVLVNARKIFQEITRSEASPIVEDVCVKRSKGIRSFFQTKDERKEVLGFNDYFNYPVRNSIGDSLSREEIMLVKGPPEECHRLRAVENSSRVIPVRNKGEFDRQLNLYTPHRFNSTASVPLTFAPSLSGGYDELAFESFYYVKITGGSALSRRYQANHYGLPVAGYVTRDKGLTLATHDLSEIIESDCLNGLSNDLINVTPSVRGYWPFGVLGSRRVAWISVPNATNISNGTSTCLVKPHLKFCAEGMLTIVGGNKTDNTYVGQPGDHFRGFDSDFEAPLLLRSIIITYNAAYSQCETFYEGAFPSIFSEGNTPSEYLDNSVCLNNLERVFTDSSLMEVGIGYESGHLVSCLIGDRTDLIDFSIARGLQAINDTNFGPMIDLRELPLHRESSFEVIAKPSNVALANFEITIPGTTSVAGRDFLAVSHYEVPNRSIPITTTPIHPITRRAQFIYSRAVVASGGADVWASIGLPMRSIVRRSVRKAKTDAHHIGDTRKGSYIEYVAQIEVRPHILLACREHSSAMMKARAILVRAAYTYGSSDSGDLFFSEAKWPHLDQLIIAEQSSIGLCRDGRIEKEISSHDDVPLFSSGMSERLAQILDENDAIQNRAFALNLAGETLNLGICPQSTTEVPEEVEFVPKSETGSWLSEIGNPISHPAISEVALAFEMPESLFPKVGNQLFLSTRRLDSSTVIDKAPAGFKPTSYNAQDVASVLSGGRILCGSSSSYMSNDRLLSHAKKTYDRKSLLDYVLGGGGLLAEDNSIWMECGFTWEAASIPSNPARHVSKETTWLDIAYFLSKNDVSQYELRNGPSFSEGASKMENSNVKPSKRKLKLELKDKTSINEIVEITRSSYTKKVQCSLGELASYIRVMHDKKKSSFLHDMALDPTSKDSVDCQKGKRTSFAALLCSLSKGNSHGGYGNTPRKIDF